MRFIHSITLAVGASLLIATLSGQVTDNAARIAPQRGAVLGGAYQVADVESINMSNGGLTFRIPLAQLPGGPNGLTSGATLTYNSKYWTVNRLFDTALPAGTLTGEDGGGWFLRFGYTLEKIVPESWSSTACGVGWGQAQDNYPVGLRLIDPDGAEHRFYLKGFNHTSLHQGCEPGLYQYTTEADYSQTHTWYTLDGSFLRLVVDAAGKTVWPYESWTLYRPDGSRVEYRRTGGPSTTLVDRNGNTLSWKQGSLTDDLGTHFTDTLSDDFIDASGNYGHKITIVHYAGVDEIRQQGNSGSTQTCGDLRSRVVYDSDGTLYPYSAIRYRMDSNNYYQPVPVTAPPTLVTRVTLLRPQQIKPGYTNVCEDQSGSFASPFLFEYNAKYREVSKMTAPSGAVATYSWAMDSYDDSAMKPMYYAIMTNAPVQKSVAYGTGTGNSTTATDVTQYNFNSYLGIITYSTVTTPDNATTRYDFVNPVHYDGKSPGPMSGTINKITWPDASFTAKTWLSNAPATSSSLAASNANPYVSFEYESHPYSSGQLVKVRSHEVDQNGNETAVESRDWAVLSAGATPTTSTGTLLARVEAPMHFVTPAAQTGPPSQTDTDGYLELTSPRLLGAPESQTVKNGSSVVVDYKEFAYDADSTMNVQQEKIYDVDGSTLRTWTYGRDGRGRVTSITDPDSIITTSSYTACNGFGLYQTKQGALTTTYAYQNPTSCPLGLIASITHPQGRVDAFTYDIWGRLTTQDEGNIRKAQYGYDDVALTIVERRDAQQYGDLNAVTVTYLDELGRTRKTRTLESAQSSSTSDATLADESNSAITVDTIYDIGTSAQGVGRNITKVSNPHRATSDTSDGWTVTFHDVLGRACGVEKWDNSGTQSGGTCSTASANNGGRTTYEYNIVATGLEAKETIIGATNRSQVRRRITDGLGRLTSVGELGPSGDEVTTYIYDAAGRLTDVNQNGRPRHYIYSEAGWLTSAQNPESGTTSYTYSPAGRLLSKTDGASKVVCIGALSGTNCSSTGAYDSAGRPTGKAYPASGIGVTYTYNTTHLETVATRESNSTLVTSVTYGYDTLDRIVSRSQTVGSGSPRIHTAQYKPNGLWTETNANGRVFTYTRDALGRVTHLQGQLGTQSVVDYITSASYAASGGPGSMGFGNGQTETRTWDYRINPLTIVRSPTFSLSFGYCGTEGTVRCAENNGNVRLQNIGHLGKKQSYDYDLIGRITEFVEGSAFVSAPACTQASTTPCRQFKYDRWGNMSISQWSTTNGVALIPPTFAPRYNQSSSVFNSNNQNTTDGLTYDAAGRVQGLGSNAFSYDSEGRLATNTLNGNVTTYTYDGEGKRVRIVTGSHVIEFVYGIDGTLAEEYDTTLPTNSGTTYVATDHLGSVRMLFSGTTPARCTDYLPFGEQMPFQMDGRTGSCWGLTDDPRTKFTGKERDQETGLDYFGARYYSAVQGRFASPDWSEAPVPIPYANLRDPQTLNRYAYVVNCPLNIVDLDGHGFWRKFANLFTEASCFCEGDEAKGRAILNRAQSEFVQQYMEGQRVAFFGGEKNMAAASVAVTIVFIGVGAVETVGAADAAALDAAVDSSATRWIRVGRWMEEEEYANMKATGMAQESRSGGGSDVAYPADIDAFGKQAERGRLYVEYDIPASTSMLPKGSGWMRIQGPNSVVGRFAAKQGTPVPQMPPVRNIEIKGQK